MNKRYTDPQAYFYTPRACCSENSLYCFTLFSRSYNIKFNAYHSLLALLFIPAITYAHLCTFTQSSWCILSYQPFLKYRDLNNKPTSRGKATCERLFGISFAAFSRLQVPQSVETLIEGFRIRTPLRYLVWSVLIRQSGTNWHLFLESVKRSKQCFHLNAVAFSSTPPILF